MIKLSVGEYCQNCPDFEPEVEKTEYSTFDHDFCENRVHTETLVMCKYRSRCLSQLDYLKKQKLKGEK